MSYRSDFPEFNSGSKEEWEVLRKLLLMFYRQKARRIETVVGSRWSPTEEELRDRLLSLAERHGILTKQGEYYLFDSAYRPVMELIQGKPLTHQPSRRFLDEFLAK